MSKNPEIIVLTFADRLVESYRVFFIPPRPDKSVVEIQVMQKHEFIEQRRLALEKYLCRLAAHPVIRKSIELRLFLQAQGKLPLPSTTDMASRMLDGAVKLPRQLFGEGNAACSAQDVAQQAKGGRDLVRMFKELRQSVTIDWGGVKPLFVEEEKEFLEKKEKLQDLEHELSDASQQVCKEAFIVWIRRPFVVKNYWRIVGNFQSWIWFSVMLAQNSECTGMVLSRQELLECCLDYLLYAWSIMMQVTHSGSTLQSHGTRFEGKDTSYPVSLNV